MNGPDFDYDRVATQGTQEEEEGVIKELTGKIAAQVEQEERVARQERMIADLTEQVSNRKEHNENLVKELTNIIKKLQKEKDNAKRVRLGSSEETSKSNSQKLDAQGGDQAGASVVDDTVEALMAGIEDSGKPPEDKGYGENNREGKSDDKSVDDESGDGSIEEEEAEKKLGKEDGKVDNTPGIPDGEVEGGEGLQGNALDLSLSALATTAELEQQVSHISAIKNPGMVSFSDSTLGPDHQSLGGLSQADMFSDLVPKPPPLPGTNAITQNKPEKTRVARVSLTSTQVGS